MNLRTTLPLFAASCVFGLMASLTSGAPAEAWERAEAARVVVLGELAGPTGPGASVNEATAETVAREVGNLRGKLAADAGLRRQVVMRAFKDAHGRAPTDQELAEALASNGTYMQTLTIQHERLKTRADDYREVLERAYQAVVFRAPFERELAYWAEREALPYVLLVASLDHWARRNQPGLMATSGIPLVSATGEYVRALTLSPRIANEVRDALGLPLMGADDGRAAYGRNLIGPGGDVVVTDGHQHLLVVGR